MYWFLSCPTWISSLRTISNSFRTSLVYMLEEICLQMRTMWLFHCLQLTSAVLLLRTETVYSGELGVFRALAQEQTDKCFAHSTCPQPFELTLSPICCGSCTCNSDCARYGSCCLGFYNDFGHALDSTANNR